MRVRKMNASWWLSRWLCLITLQSVASADVTITSSPKLGAGTVLCDNDNVTLSCHTDHSAANFTWHWSNQSEQGDTIIVAAKLTKVVYTCVVSDDGQDIGTANITVSANGSAPHVASDNFYPYILKTEGSNLTLITSITSNLSLSSGWQVIDHKSLPSTAVVDNYTTTDGILHSKLSLYNLSYYNDSGNYTNTASNKCGTSFVFTFIQVTKAPMVCEDPAHVAIPLHDVTMTVQGETINLSCLFKGNLDRLDTSLTSYWRINFSPSQQYNGSLYVDDNSTDLYRIAVYQTCSGTTCCTFINQLIILDAPLSLNDATLTCTESLNVAGSDKPVEYTSNTTILIPRIISGPVQLEGEGPTVLQCQFNASTRHGVTIVVWKRNNIELHNSSLYIIIQSVSPAKDYVVSTLMINSTSDYYGTYTCYCYYNRSLVMSTKPITSNEISITLHRNKHAAFSKYAKIGIGTGGVVIGTIIVAATLIIIFFYRRRPDSGNELKPLLSSDENIINEVAAVEDTSGQDYRTFPQVKQATVFGDSANGDSSTLRTAIHQDSNITAVDHTSQITTTHQSLTNSTSVADDPAQKSGYQD